MFIRGTADILRVNVATAADIEANLDVLQCDDSTPPVVQPVPNFGPVASITGTGNTTLVDGSGLTSGHAYKVKRCSLYNNHATQSTVVRVERNDGSNTCVESNVTLLAGESLVYNENGDWTHYDANGGIYSAAPLLDVRLRVTADQAFATAVTLADITDLSGTPIKNGKKYAFEICLFTTNNASTTGSQFAVNGPAATTFIAGEIGAVTNSPTAAALGIGTAVAVNGIIVAQTTGQTAVGPHFIMGYYEPSADGTFAVRAASEISVAAGLTVKKGSWLRLWEVQN